MNDCQGKCTFALYSTMDLLQCVNCGRVPHSSEGIWNESAERLTSAQIRDLQAGTKIFWDQAFVQITNVDPYGIWADFGSGITEYLSWEDLGAQCMACGDQGMQDISTGGTGNYTWCSCSVGKDLEKLQREAHEPLGD